MARPSTSQARSGLGELLAGSSETIAGTVYGTIIVMATLVAGAPAFRDKLWTFVAVLVTTTVVFWIAHIYAHGLAESLQLRRRLTAAGPPDEYCDFYCVPEPAIVDAGPGDPDAKGDCPDMACDYLDCPAGCELA